MQTSLTPTPTISPRKDINRIKLASIPSKTNTSKNETKENQQKSYIQKQGKVSYQIFEPPSFFQSLIYLLVRPPKLKYSPSLLNLGNYESKLFTHSVQKIPFDLSLYIPHGEVKYVVLYLHGNSSNRLEGSVMLRHLPPKVGLACFDFQGCGNRDGKWISLGIKQSKEVDIAAKHIKKLGYKAIGWGRSMGAVSLLLSSELDIMVADSPFQSIRKLGLEFGKSIPYVPYCLYCCVFPCVFFCVNCDVQKKIQTSFASSLDVVKRVQQIPSHKSILFLCGMQDQIISPDHAQELHNSFKGYKELIIFPGTHNSSRPDEIHDKIICFIQKALQTSLKVQEAPRSITQNHLPYLGSVPSQIREITVKANENINGFSETTPVEPNSGLVVIKENQYSTQHFLNAKKEERVAK